MGGVATAGDGSFTELLQTHPSIQGRLRLAREFGGSPRYAPARNKVLAAARSGSLMSVCRHCSFVSPRAEAFCPNCGLSRR